jgi:integrase
LKCIGSCIAPRACTRRVDSLAPSPIDLSGQTQGAACGPVWRIQPFIHGSMQSMLDRQGPHCVTPYILRHTWLYMLRQKGISVEIRAELAGHSLE